MSGQSIQDRIIAAKHSIAGQGLAKAVCKATTEEVMGPKRKHLEYLVQCTHEPNVSIPQLANLLIERTQHSNWVVVFKSLVTMHHVMNYGNERFSQFLASNNCTLNLGNFLDKTGAQGYDMSTYIRRYGKYINGKATSYRSMAYDFCKIKRGKEDGLLRTMSTESLLKALPVLQDQLDNMLEFDATPNELTNGVINAAFMLMFKDLIRLFACYNDGIINLLEKFFEMPKKQCKDAFDIYKRFLARMERCAEVLKTAENVGIDKGDIPDLTKAPSSLLEALEEHIKSLDGQKTKGERSKPVVAAAISEMKESGSTAAGDGGQVSEEERKKILEEEERQLEQLKEKQKKTSGGTTPTRPAGTPTRPVQSPIKETIPELSRQEPVLEASKTSPVNQEPSTAARPSDDLLGLDGPDMFPSNITAALQNAPAGASGMGPGLQGLQMGMQPGTTTVPPASYNPFMQPHPMAGNAMAGNTMAGNNIAGNWGTSYPPVNFPPMTATQASPSRPTGPDTFGDILLPMSTSNPAATSPSKAPGGMGMGAGSGPAGGGSSLVGGGGAGGKLIGGDIDASLASLAGSLTMNDSPSKISPNWGKSNDKRMTGGVNWAGIGPAPATVPYTGNKTAVSGQPHIQSQPNDPFGAL